MWNYSNGKNNYSLGSNVYWNSIGNSVAVNATAYAWQMIYGTSNDSFKIIRNSGGTGANNVFTIGLNTFNIDNAGAITIVGSLSVGTTSTLNKFDIYGGAQTTNSTAYISFLPASQTIGLGREGIWFDYNTTSHYGMIQCEWYGHSYYPLCLNPYGANVGIGTTNPQYLLDVAGNIRCVNLSQSSDRRIKKNIISINGSIDLINRITPRSYNYITDISGSLLSYGFIADELQEILPTLVTGDKDSVLDDGTPNIQSVNYTGLIPFLVGAIQEQQALIITLQEQIATITTEMIQVKQLLNI